MPPSSSGSSSSDCFLAVGVVVAKVATLPIFWGPSCGCCPRSPVASRLVSNTSLSLWGLKMPFARLFKLLCVHFQRRKMKKIFHQAQKVEWTLTAQNSEASPPKILEGLLGPLKIFTFPTQQGRERKVGLTGCKISTNTSLAATDHVSRPWKCLWRWQPINNLNRDFLSGSLTSVSENFSHGKACKVELFKKPFPPRHGSISPHDQLVRRDLFPRLLLARYAIMRV